MICSSVNRFVLIVRSHVGGLYSQAVLFAGVTSYRPNVTRISSSKSVNPRSDPRSGLRVVETRKPSVKGLRLIRLRYHMIPNGETK